jgi:hypothetical protein
VTPSRYRIVLGGRLSERFESAFDGMALEPGPNQTVLVGDIRDQAHLYGLFDPLRDFGIELVAVEPEPPGTADTGAEHCSPHGPHGRGRRAHHPHPADPCAPAISQRPHRPAGDLSGKLQAWRVGDEFLVRSPGSANQTSNVRYSALCRSP